MTSIKNATPAQMAKVKERDLKLYNTQDTGTLMPAVPKGITATSVAPNGPYGMPPSKLPQGSGPRPTGPALGGVGPRPTGPGSPTDMTKINALKAQLKGQNSSDTGSMSPRRVAAKLSGMRGAMAQPPVQLAPKGPKPTPMNPAMMKKGGAVKASKRADGIAQRGKTKGRMV